MSAQCRPRPGVGTTAFIYQKEHGGASTSTHKIVRVDGHAVARFTAEERQYMRDSLPEGYRYLSIMQRRPVPMPRNAG